jgi:hypothetical protein
VIATLALAGAFAALQNEWSHIRDYTVNVEAHEVIDGRAFTDVLRYAYRRPDRARLEITSGAQRGSVVIWNGDDRATAYRRGLSFLKLRFGVKDRRVTSARGNGILTPNFDTIIRCFEAHPQSISESPGPAIDGDATTAITLTRDGFACPEDSTLDHDLTRDVLYVSNRTHLPLLRERYAGSARVEAWKLTNLKINSGLTDRDLR